MVYRHIHGCNDQQYCNKSYYKISTNRKEGNDQVSIQLPSVKDTKGKKDALKARASKLKHYKQKAKKDSFFPKKLTIRLSKIKKFHQDIYAKTYNERNSEPQQKHHLRKVS